MTILISRTDGIGDVVLTLPVAGVIKHYFAGSKVLFLGKSYTKAVIDLCTDVDEFINWDEIEKNPTEVCNILQNKHIDIVIHVFPNKKTAKICKKAGIKYRIGTSHRLYNWLFCNRLAHFSRRNSEEHESILNLNLLEKVSGFKNTISFDEIGNFLHLDVQKVSSCADSLLEDDNYFKLILHPKSKGSAREWGLENFNLLIKSLDKTKFRIFVCGTEEEGQKFRKDLFATHYDNVYDLSGKLSLAQYISLIASSNALVAASTGPLHIAGALNKHAIGLFPPIRPMNPGRWQPIGKNVKIFCKDQACNDCRKTNNCKCMQSISAEEVTDYLRYICEKGL